MIQIICRDSAYAYDAYHLIKAFFPNAEITQKIGKEQEPLISVEIEGGSCFCCRFPAEASGKAVSGTGPDREKYKVSVTGETGGDKNSLNRSLYYELSKITGRTLPWGVLTGVRPTKLTMSRIEKGEKPEQAQKWLEKTYLVSEEKARLSAEIAGKELQLLDRLDYQNGYSLYVGIPFCPSICAYCSFSSSPIDRWRDQVDRYLDALCRELTFIGTASRGKKLDTVYVGGGTPTTLEAEQLERLLDHLERTFPYDAVKEVTVEAGRPDSITAEKLRVLKRHRVSRISINPQTMQQRTLDRIGRRHTVEDIVRTFHMARDLGFDNLNMDLIAGLPGEDNGDMEDTLRQIKALGPDSLTLHSLAVKRAAVYGRYPVKPVSEEEMHRMIACGAASAKEMGLKPYYLYRQKNIAGNFENVGYAKVDKAGIYNILIMEEKQSIVAAGAGASTKIVLDKPIAREDGKKTNIVRIENVKGILEYMDRIDEMIERKEEWIWR